jgi:hypothetical protein
MSSIVISISDFQVASVGDWVAGSRISATDIVYVAFRQEGFRKASRNRPADGRSAKSEY